MNGFLMMMTQNGKLLYISDNAAEYLGHSMASSFLSSLKEKKKMIIITYTLFFILMALLFLFQFLQCLLLVKCWNVFLVVVWARYEKQFSTGTKWTIGKNDLNDRL